jgi:DNA-binding transcriptional ArsR family regulator
MNMSLKKIPLSLLFYALSDPARLEIIRGLMEEEEVSCGACKSSLSKSTMSHHFKVLREAGFIQRREEGKVHFISLRQKEIETRLPGLLSLLERAKTPL